jgi:hypothetical protein
MDVGALVTEHLIEEKTRRKENAQRCKRAPTRLGFGKLQQKKLRKFRRERCVRYWQLRTPVSLVCETVTAAFVPLGRSVRSQS